MECLGGHRCVRKVPGDVQTVVVVLRLCCELERVPNESSKGRNTQTGPLFSTGRSHKAMEPELLLRQPRGHRPNRRCCVRKTLVGRFAASSTTENWGRTRLSAKKMVTYTYTASPRFWSLGNYRIPETIMNADLDWGNISRVHSAKTMTAGNTEPSEKGTPTCHMMLLVGAATVSEKRKPGWARKEVSGYCPRTYGDLFCLVC